MNRTLKTSLQNHERKAIAFVFSFLLVVNTFNYSISVPASADMSLDDLVEWAIPTAKYALTTLKVVSGDGSIIDWASATVDYASTMYALAKSAENPDIANTSTCFGQYIYKDASGGMSYDIVAISGSELSGGQRPIVSDFVYCRTSHGEFTANIGVNTFMPSLYMSGSTYYVSAISGAGQFSSTFCDAEYDTFGTVGSTSVSATSSIFNTYISGQFTGQVIGANSFYHSYDRLKSYGVVAGEPASYALAFDNIVNEYPDEYRMYPIPHPNSDNPDLPDLPNADIPSFVLPPDLPYETFPAMTMPEVNQSALESAKNGVVAHFSLLTHIIEEFNLQWLVVVMLMLGLFLMIFAR